jgi:hypothetical protein
MNLPGFTAEAGVYRTNNHYRLAAGGTFLGGAKTTAVPQGCGLFQGIFCGAVIALGSAACLAFCLSGPAPCFGCWTIELGGLYESCKDCIPAWMKALIDEFEGGGGSGGGGGGGGGGSTCCPPGKRCCGTCVKVAGGTKCDDVCVGLHQVCP